MSFELNKSDHSLRSRARSFAHAGRGLSLFIKTAHNGQIQLIVFIVAIILGFYFGIGRVDWILLMFAGGFVLAAEAFNSAIEIDMNLTSPEYHPAARDTKDVAAGAVLLAAITAGAIWILIFLPYFLG